MDAILQSNPPPASCPVKQYVCRCLRVTDQDVREAMAAGAGCDLADLMKHTGAGTGCMACRASIRKLVAD